MSDFAAADSSDYPKLSSFYKPSIVEYGENNFSLPLTADTIYGDSVSKRSVELFPAINTMRPGFIEQKCTKHVGLAVFVAFRDESNESKISFKLVEMFTG